MYQPPHFVEDDLARKQAFVHDCPFGLMVTAGPSGLLANGLPWLLDTQAGAGVLRGHVARANGQWRDCVGGIDALVVFQGPDHYVSPSWYATKAQTHKVVPTWNYAMVQARGVARAIEDPAWLHRQIRGLTDLMEGRRPQPWAVDDAPPAFVEAQVRGIVGIEIEIAALDGKWKASQNRPEADRAGVAEGLSGLGSEAAATMAAMVRDRGRA